MTRPRPDSSRSYVLEKFVSWLLGKDSQSELDGASRTFRDQISWLWDVIPKPVMTGEIHHTIIVDGIRVGDMVCLLLRQLIMQLFGYGHHMKAVNIGFTYFV